MSSNGMNGMGGLPGANAMGDTLEFVKNLWGAMKIPGMSMPSLSPEEIDKQIADLKAVESWLQVNMNMLRGSIQALEVQSATLSALRSVGQRFTQTAAPQASGATADQPPPFESPFASRSTTENSSDTADNGASSTIPEAAALAAQLANPAVWWNAVQEQFSTAVSQAMTPAKKPAAKRAKASATSARKSGATKASSKTSTTARKRTPKS